MMLKNIWVIKKRKDGQKVYYAINQEVYNNFIQDFTEIFVLTK